MCDSLCSTDKDEGFLVTYQFHHQVEQPRMHSLCRNNQQSSFLTSGSDQPPHKTALGHNPGILLVISAAQWDHTFQLHMVE